MPEPRKEYVLYGGEVVLQFDEAAHKYYWNGDVVPSTTTITHVIDKSDMLMPWAVKMAVEWLKKQILPGEKYDRMQLDHILNMAKNAHRHVSGKATDIGKEVHNWIEQFINSELGVGEPLALPVKEDVGYGVAAFLDWYEKHHVEPIASEQKVFSRKYGFSGTFDFLAKVDGILTVVDFKTSRDLYPDYLIQGAAYAMAYEEEHGIMPEQVTILHTPKIDKGFSTKSTTDIAAHFDVFKSCLAIYNWKNKKGDYKDLNIYGTTSRKGRG